MYHLNRKLSFLSDFRRSHFIVLRPRLQPYSVTTVCGDDNEEAADVNVPQVSVGRLNICTRWTF